MSRIVEAHIDIGRPPEEVFDYVSDATLLPEWQPDVETAQADPPGIPAVGMRGHDVRRTPSGKRTLRWEVTECERGRRWALRGIEGPVRAQVTMTFAPTGEGARTTVGYRIWFEGHGLGKLVVPLARHGAANDIAASLALLKGRLEAREPAPDAAEAMTAPSTETVRRWVEEMWNGRQYGLCEELIAPQFVEHAHAPFSDQEPGLVDGPQTMRASMEWLIRQFPDVSMVIEAVVNEGDLVAARVLSTGTNLGPLNGVIPPTGRTFRAEQTHWFRLEGRRIVEHWATRDDLTSMLQLGVLSRPGPGGGPPPAPSGA